MPSSKQNKVKTKTEFRNLSTLFDLNQKNVLMGQGMSNGSENVVNLDESNQGSEDRDNVRSDSSSDNSSDDETTVMETSLRSLIRAITSGSHSISFRSGQSTVVADDTESDSDDISSGEFPKFYRAPPIMKTHVPDTSKIKTNEISSLISRDAEFSSERSLLQALRIRHLGGLKRKPIKEICSHLVPDSAKELAGFRNKLFCGVYGRGGDIFLSACQDRFLRIYDTRGGNFDLLQSIKARDVGWSVLDVALSPDGTHLVYSSWNDYLYQVHILGDNYDDDAYSVHQVPLCLEPPGYIQFCIFSVKFSQDSSEVMGGANDGCIYLYNREANTQSLRIQAHDNDVNAVCFVDETTHIVASGGDDGLCKVWDRRALRESNPKPVGVLAGHRDGIGYLDPKGDGRFLISNSKDQSIKLWDIRRFSQDSEIEQGKIAVRKNNTWDYRWERVPKKVTKQPQLSGDSSVMTYCGHRVLQTLIRCHFSPHFTTGQRYIYTGCATGAIVIYDILTGEIVKVLSGHRACVRDVSWHPYVPEIISSSWDMTVKRWSPRGQDKEEFEERRDKISSKRKKREASGALKL